MTEQLNRNASPAENLHATDALSSEEDAQDDYDDEQRLQLEASFNFLASILEQADWKNEEIELISTAVYGGVNDELRDVVAPQLGRLRKNMVLVDMRESEKMLWEQWSAGWTLEQIESAYHDLENHSAHKLRMRIARLVAKLGAQTY